MASAEHQTAQHRLAILLFSTTCVSVLLFLQAVSFFVRSPECLSPEAMVEEEATSSRRGESCMAAGGEREGRRLVSL